MAGLGAKVGTPGNLPDERVGRGAGLQPGTGMGGSANREPCRIRAGLAGHGSGGNSIFNRFRMPELRPTGSAQRFSSRFAVGLGVVLPLFGLEAWVCARGRLSCSFFPGLRAGAGPGAGHSAVREAGCPAMGAGLGRGFLPAGRDHLAILLFPGSPEVPDPAVPGDPK